MPGLRADLGKMGSGWPLPTTPLPRRPKFSWAFKVAFLAFRQVSKPLMEKRRRARINLSLEQLKGLLEKHYSHQVRFQPRRPLPLT